MSQDWEMVADKASCHQLTLVYLFVDALASAMIAFSFILQAEWVMSSLISGYVTVHALGWTWMHMFVLAPVLTQSIVLQ